MSCPECRSGHCHRLQVQYKAHIEKLKFTIKEHEHFIAILEKQIAQMACGHSAGAQS